MEMMNKTDSTDSDIASTSGSKPIDQQQHEVNIPAPRRPNLPIQDLVTAGPSSLAREEYKRIGVPLYEASIKCDWKAAKAILDEKPELVRYSLIETGETALHISASVKKSKHAEKFVKNLVGMMKTEDLELENIDYNTALLRAAANGNIKTVRVMVEKNRILTSCDMKPLYAAAMFGNYEVGKYLYENSNELRDDGWNHKNRGSLLKKCVEGDMFDIALKILECYPDLINRVDKRVLRILARKPDAFSETKTSIIKIIRSISSALSFIGLKVRAPEKESSALTLLRFVWDGILEKPKEEIDSILRGPEVLIEQDIETVSGRAIQTVKLQKLISEHVAKMKEETNNIITRSPDSTNQDTKQASVKEEQVVELQNLISERLVTMHDETQKIIKSPPDLIKQDNTPVFSKGDPALKLRSLIFKHVADMHDKTQKVNRFEREYQAKLEEVISEQIRKIESETNRIIEESRWSGSRYRYPSQVLFIAAEKANTNFVVELIRKYPDLISKVNDNNQSIFHIGVEYRHVSIYNLLYEIGPMKDLITHCKDENDNNMLHLAGKMAPKERLADVPGAALQMQRELLWFKEVRNMMPPSLREQKNKDGLTPRELFTEEHKELIRDGEKWVKETANQCMIAAALIATITFTAAFTVPGGYNQDDGIPIFYRERAFVIFVVADAVSLFLSSASILTCLSLFTCCYPELDFVESLPSKLAFGIQSLLSSVGTMLITFSISLYIIYQKEMIWIPVLVSALAIMPVLLYTWLQYNMLADVIRSSYGSRYLFKPDKQFLYYVNTKPQGVSEL